MALGLPGLRVDGPIFITGEPLREYNFCFRLTKPEGKMKDSPAWTKVLFSDLFLLYVSGLAETVTLAPEKFNLGSVQVGTLKLSFPQGFDIPTFSVAYLEDEIMSVARFHMIWQNNIRGQSEKDARFNNSGGGMLFEEIGRVCCGAVYAPSKRIPNPIHNNMVTNYLPATPPVEIPLGGETFPYIYPVSIQRGAGNRSGNNVSKTTITYARIPDIHEFSSSGFGKPLPGTGTRAPDSTY